MNSKHASHRREDVRMEYFKFILVYPNFPESWPMTTQIMGFMTLGRFRIMPKRDERERRRKQDYANLRFYIVQFERQKTIQCTALSK